MSRLHFLMLEDNPTDAELISTTVENSDLDCTFTIVETQSDFEAVIESQPVDLVFADYSLPNFDGLSAIELVTTRFPHIPCILVSGVLGEERAVEALKRGAANYVLKQRLERLVPVTRRALREYRERQALAVATAQLKESEARFRTSVETMADPLAIVFSVRDLDDVIQSFALDYLNEAACIYLSVTLEQQKGKPLYEVIPTLRQSTNDSLFYAFCSVVETGCSTCQEITVKGMAAEDKDEPQQVVLDIRAAKLNDGLVITWRDITERQKTAQQRLVLLSEAERARNRAEQANRHKDAFLAHLSHELRSPLSAIKGWLQIITQSSYAPDKLPKILESLDRNADLLEALISDLINNAQFERGHFSFNLQTLKFQDLINIVETAIEAINPIAQTKNIAVEFLPEKVNNVKITGDSTRLEQVVRNLLSNAIKFTPEQGKVTLKLSGDQHSITLSVEDTGEGMDANTVNHVFERFWQSPTRLNGHSSSSRVEGLGLGLSIAHHIVEAHGGKITAASEGMAQGSTFTVQLPIKHNNLNGNPLLSSEMLLIRPENRLSEALTHIDEVERDRAESGVSLKGIRVLVVEDYPDALEAYVLMLESRGAQVEGVRSADAALEIFSKFEPHVLVSDLNLPGESGYSLIRKIRSLPIGEGGNIPAIALTAYTEDPYCTRALLAGFQLHIAKPIELKDMAKLVAKLHQSATKETTTA